MIYDSERDAWLMVMIWAGAAGSIIAGVAILASPAPILLRVLVFILFLAAAGCMFWIVYGTRYTMTASELAVRCGPFRYRIPLARIDSVVPSRNRRSSPALSLDRLLIEWNQGDRRLLVSPVRREDFLAQLEEHSPQLKRTGGSLNRIP